MYYLKSFKENINELGGGGNWVCRFINGIIRIKKLIAVFFWFWYLTPWIKMQVQSIHPVFDAK